MQKKLYLQGSPQFHCLALAVHVQPAPALEWPRSAALPEMLTAPRSAAKAFGEERLAALTTVCCQLRWSCSYTQTLRENGTELLGQKVF